MTLDNKLNWDKHINKLRVKTKRVLNTIRVVAGKKCGGDRKTLKKFYSAICRTKMDYGCQLCNTASTGILKKLDSIHREGIRIYRSFQNFTSRSPACGSRPFTSGTKKE